MHHVHARIILVRKTNTHHVSARIILIIYYVLFASCALTLVKNTSVGHKIEPNMLLLLHIKHDLRGWGEGGTGGTAYTNLLLLVICFGLS